MTDTAIAKALEDANLDAATNAAINAVKAKPNDAKARLLLIDILIAAGDLSRADKQAEILQRTHTDIAVGIGLLRGRLRAAQLRVDWFTAGASPAFPDGPTARDQLAMKMTLAARDGDEKAVADLLRERAALDETTVLCVDGGVPCPFRDADDRVAHVLEVLTTGGQYMWIDFALVDSVDFAPPQGLRDLVWRRASLVLKDGSQSDVVTCATYYSDQADGADRLGRETGWSEWTGGLVTGSGQKAMLAGDEAVFALEIEHLSGPEAS